MKTYIDEMVTLHGRAALADVTPGNNGTVFKLRHPEEINLDDKIGWNRKTYTVVEVNNGEVIGEAK